MFGKWLFCLEPESKRKKKIVQDLGIMNEQSYKKKKTM